MRNLNKTSLPKPSVQQIFSNTGMLAYTSFLDANVHILTDCRGNDIWSDVAIFTIEDGGIYVEN